MRAFNTFTGLVAPIDRPNVDTDAIIPKQYLKSIKRTGFGVNLFDDWRYLDPGEVNSDHSSRRLNPEFVLNEARYNNAEILLTRENFGCGSSREHAVWALMDYGIRALIAPSYGDIFYSNAGKNGLLLIQLDNADIEHLFATSVARSAYQLCIDLAAQTVADNTTKYSFDIDSGLKERLLLGQDDIEITLQYADDIHAYEDKQAIVTPWLFTDRA